MGGGGPGGAIWGGGGGWMDGWMDGLSFAGVPGTSGCSTSRPAVFIEFSFVGQRQPPGRLPADWATYSVRAPPCASNLSAPMVGNGKQSPGLPYTSGQFEAARAPWMPMG